MAKESLCFFVCISSLLLLLPLQNVHSGPTTENVKISKHPVILIVSYDGFAASYLAKVKTPTLDKLRGDGVHVPYMEPVFPTKTFPNHQSIATGLYAEGHGIVDNVFFDPFYNKTLVGYKDDPGFWNYNQNVLPIWLHNEMAGDGRVSGALMWPGSSQPYGVKNDTLPTYYYPKYDGGVPWESRVDTVISWITNDTKPANLVFLYYDEPDSKGHGFGPDSPQTREEIVKCDNRTAYLVDQLTKAGIFDKINLIILSDHGMAGVSADRIINLNDTIDHNLIEGMYGSSPVLQFVPKEGKQEDLYQDIKKGCQTTGHCSVWKKGSLHHPYYFSSSRRVLNLTVIAEPGYVFDDFKNSVKYYDEKWNLTANSSREYGVHGYENTHVSMRPMFVAHGPAFRQGFDLSPIKNVDIVPLICGILKLPEPPNNGSLSRVVKMINPAYLPNSCKKMTSCLWLEHATDSTPWETYWIVIAVKENKN